MIRAFVRLSYFAKFRTKRYGGGNRNFGYGLNLEAAF